MNKLYRIVLVTLMGALAAGCANQEIKPATVLCPLLGATLGAGVAAAGVGGDDAGPMAAGAVLGAAAGYFLCREKPATPPACAKSRRASNA